MGTSRGVRRAALAEFAARAGRSPLVADPGTKRSCAMQLEVLAAVVERAAVETCLRRRLSGPIGMTSTGWSVPASQVGRLATNCGPAALIGANRPGTWSPVRDGLMRVDLGTTSIYRNRPSLPYGDAGLVSSERDHDRFLRMPLNGRRYGGKRILDPLAVRLATPNLRPSGVVLTNSSPVPRDETSGHGAGGFLMLEGVDGFGRHLDILGWHGAAGTRTRIDPARELRATMMVNVSAAGKLGNDLDETVARNTAAH